jgi:enterochelin esterase-like enzyme/dienelactone hydrolase
LTIDKQFDLFNRQMQLGSVSIWRFVEKGKMQHIQTLLLVVLSALFSANVCAQERSLYSTTNGTDELPWVTSQVDAPRVSFHTFTSRAANAKVSYHVYTPLAYEESESARFPVLYWLHGTDGGVNHIRPVAQIFHSAIRDNKVPPMIVVFVNGLSKRLWTDSKDGLAPIETIFIEELIPHIDKSMRTIPRREGRILEGFSMGGYGAARIGFQHAELFGGISILAAGPLDLEFEGPRATGNPLRDQILKDVCDGDMAYFKATHPWTIAGMQAEVLRKTGTIIRQVVGSKDFSLYLSRRFHEHLESLGIPHEFQIVDDVGHDTLLLLAGLANSEFYQKVFTSKAVEVATVNARGPDYDPLAVATQIKPVIVDMTINDFKRQRDVPIRVYLPQAVQTAPVILFSHGLGGSREGNAYLGEHWATRGFATVFLQHPGSDSHVWQDVPKWRRMQSLRNAASTKNFLLRVKDVVVVLDQLEEWNKTKGHVLAGRLELRKVGMAGHSFGAVVSQAVSGQQTASGKKVFVDARIAAAVIMSPSSPKRGTPQTAFGSVALPWMLMTGTRDTALIGGADVESRLAVFPALPPGGKYELVLFEAEHSAFTDSVLPGDVELKNPNHHRVILALSTAFWDTFLLGNVSAQQWLDGDGPKTILQDKDRWQKK